MTGCTTGPPATDGLRIDFGAPGPGVVLAGAPVIQACNLLSPTDLHTAGIHPPVAVERAVLDGHIGPPLRLARALPAGLNTCRFTAGPGEPPLAAIEVAQPTYVEQAAIDAHRRGLDPGPIHAGVDTATRRTTDPTAGEWVLLHQDVLVDLQIHGADPAIREALLAVVARRLVDQVRAPAGPPPLTHTAVGPCELLGNDEFRTAHAEDSAPTATEHFGVARALEGGCRRHGTRPDLSPREQPTLDVRTLTHPHVDAAHQHLEHHRPATPIPDVGDEALLVDLPDRPHVLLLRRGPIVVELHATPPPTDTGRLTTIAATIADRLDAYT
ncbi:MAG TPA: hypothetical protein VGD67_08150 [Pseudonocardiaceae bacterium]